METNVSDLIVGLMMAVFGLIGLFLVAGAADVEMYVFGLCAERVRRLFRFRPDTAPLRPTRCGTGRGAEQLPCLTPSLAERPVDRTMTRW